MLSISMIVLNEEKNIRRALDSVQFADEIIIVDTGSTDKTKEICLEYDKVKLYDFEWVNDYSEARNVSIGKCTGDMILVLDADEEINDKEGLLELIRQDKPAYMIYQMTKVGNTILPCKTTRLIKNGLGFKFELPVHETLDTSIVNQGYVIENTTYTFKHYGYQANDKAKNGRIIEILLEKYHPLKNFYLGLSYYNLGHDEEAFKYFSEATNEPLCSSIKAFVYTVLGKLYLDTCIKGIGTVLSYLNESIKLIPNQYAGYMVASEAYEATGDKEQAIITLEKILERNKIGVSGMHQDTIIDIKLIKDKINSLKEA